MRILCEHSGCQYSNIIGNMCNEPELRSTKDGKAVTNFTVAVNWMDGQGTDYFNVSAWERRAEICAKHLHKGDRVAVSGTISGSTTLKLFLMKSR